jgi:hypothetical protein
LVKVQILIRIVGQDGVNLKARCNKATSRHESPGDGIA